MLDVRDHGVYARGHLLFAVNAPYWRLELDVGNLVPRRDTRIVVVDGGQDENTAQDAASKLAALGYPGVEVLSGGLAAWRAAGLEVFTGTNVPSKAFGELLEEDLNTPHIEAQDLHDRLARGERLVVVDSRTPEEFAAFSIPGAHSLPGAELVYRIEEVAPSADTLVVVNCAGRTRSILGAQTLINAGLPNRVVSLRNGTMAWLQAGYTLDSGRTSTVPEPSAAHREHARQRAEAMARRAGVQVIDRAKLQALVDDTARTVFRFDVRGREEYQAGHLPGFRHAAGGQLVQATDEYIGVRHARVVLADWDGVRALTTAAWLSQLGGLDVYVYPVGTPEPLQTGPEPRVLLPSPHPEVPWALPSVAHQAAEAGQAVLLDIDDSVAYARAHAAGARFSAPSHVLRVIAGLPEHQGVLLLSRDGVLARVAAQEASQRTGRVIRPVLGGTAGWVAAGLPTGAGREGVLSGADDTWPGPYVFDSLEERNQNFDEYLAWELGLVEQLQRHGETGMSLSGSLRAPADVAAHRATF